jgi:hypothetical protein
MQISSKTTSRRNLGMLKPDCSGFMLIVSLAADTIGSITGRQTNKPFVLPQQNTRLNEKKKAFG